MEDYKQDISIQPDYLLICLVAANSFESDNSLRTHLLSVIPEGDHFEVVEGLASDRSSLVEDLADLKRQVCHVESHIAQNTRVIRLLTDS
jgi:hypothetical protein